MTTSVLDGRESLPRMVFAVSGSTGLVGSAVVRNLTARGHEIRRIVRRASASGSDIPWDTTQGTIDGERLDGVDVVIHLAGENLAQRWTNAARRRIRESRVDGTLALARTLAGMARKPRVLLSASAVGF